MNAFRSMTSALLMMSLLGCAGCDQSESAEGVSNTEAANPVSSSTGDAAPQAKPGAADNGDAAASSASSRSIQQTSSQQDAANEPAEPGPISVSLCSEGLPTKGMWKCDPVFGDVNKDGHVDLAAIPRLGDGPVVWLGDGAGNWTESSNGLKRNDGKSCGGGVRLHDVNNDGNLDLCVADHCSGVFVYLGDGKGNWDMVLEHMYPSDAIPENSYAEKFKGAESIAVGDIDKDGNADLVVGASDDAGIRLYLGDGTGRNWARRDGILPGRGWATRVQLHDMNDDGWLDVVSSYSAGPRVWLNINEGGAWQEASAGLPSPMMGGIFHGLAIGDINNDDRQDFAIANWVDGPEVYLQQENGTWRKTDDVFPDMLGGAVGLDLGDLDKDGNLDMVVTGRLELDAGYVRGVFALLGDGKGEWEYLEHSGLPGTGLSGMTGAAVHDINDDGTLDIAACSGLIVESVRDGRRKPAVPFNLQVWCTELRARAAAAAPEG